MANNRELPLIMGQMTIFPKHFWQDKDFASTSLKVIPIGSGPYKIKSIDAGRNITYERVKDWWAKDLPINKGRYNFDEISYDYYKDSTVALEAFFSNEYDFRSENIAKSWFTAYDKKPVNEGKIIKKELIHERPTGMQGFAFNTRRDMFKDKIVRKAIGMAFDFEWSNKQFAFSSYKRTNSYFSNSELASQGIPTGAELHVLEDFKGDIANEIFIKPFKNPKTDGTGRGVRKNIREASKILTKSGWLLDKEKNIRMKDGKELSFEILSRSPDFERWVNPLIKNLGMLGIKARFRVVDTAQYQNRMDSFDFDMTIATFGQSLSPGNEQRDFWHSSKADVNGSRNIIGIKNPVIDELIDLVIKAKSREDLIAATRALDRVLLSEYYVIPQWHLNSFRIAYWDKFGRPDINPKYGLPVQETWWVKEAQTESPMESK